MRHADATVVVPMDIVCVPLAAAFWHQSRLYPLAGAGQLDDITRRISAGLLGQDERRRYFERAKATLAAGP